MVRIKAKKGKVYLILLVLSSEMEDIRVFSHLKLF